jgi:hypothetical protein
VCQFSGKLLWLFDKHLAMAHITKKNSFVYAKKFAKLNSIDYCLLGCLLMLLYMLRAKSTPFDLGFRLATFSMNDLL